MKSEYVRHVSRTEEMKMKINTCMVRNLTKRDHLGDRVDETIILTLTFEQHQKLWVKVDSVPNSGNVGSLKWKPSEEQYQELRNGRSLEDYTRKAGFTLKQKSSLRNERFLKILRLRCRGMTGVTCQTESSEACNINLMSLPHIRFITNTQSLPFLTLLYNRWKT